MWYGKRIPDKQLNFKYLPGWGFVKIELPNIFLHTNIFIVIMHFLCYYCAAMREIAKYMEQYFGLQAGIKPLKKAELANLPLYLRSNYNISHGTLNGQKMIWAELENDVNSTPDQLKKQNNQLRQLLHVPVVFVFDKLDSWQRKRLIEKQVAFAQPFKQLFVPELLLQLNDVASSQNMAAAMAEKLTAPAQFAILYHLQVASLEQRPFQQIASLLQYSTMTITRLIKELQNAQLLSVEGSKEKSVKFNLSKKELWHKALPLLNTPVREIFFTDDLPNSKHFKISGDTALAAYSMLAESLQKTYAIGKDEFRSLKGSLKNIDSKNGGYKIEVWHYNPLLLSQRNKVDKLSLYLSMQQEQDERIQRALQDFLNDMEW